MRGVVRTDSMELAERTVSADEFIEAAIAHGQRVGLDALSGLERTVFLISEDEVDCANDGLDSFAERRGAAGLLEAADAFRSMGAVDLAGWLTKCAGAPDDFSGAAFDAANTLVNDHVGWDYESIRVMVACSLGPGTV